MTLQGTGGAAVKPVTVFVREFKAGATGPDVLAVKRALVAAGDGKGISTATNVFGAGAITQLKAFQRQHKLPQTGIYNTATQLALQVYFDAYGHELLSKEAIKLAKQTALPKLIASAPPSLRAQYVETVEWGVPHHAFFNYFETRPMPLTVEKHDYENSGTEPIDTDCSGWVTGAAYLTPGCHDPNGLNFNGQGYTGTILEYCDRIAIADCQPGDLFVYGPLPTGWHVSVAVAKQPNGDWMTVSNGHQGCPEYVLHSAMAAAQAANGHPGVTVCRFLPV